MDYIRTKTIMTKSENGKLWFGIDYHMNLYRGCNYGCIYCDSRSEAYHIVNFEKIVSKVNALEILEEELASKQYKGVVSFGTLSDPYNEKEKKYKITRKALELIKKYEFGVSIDTKSDLILRDMDLLKEIQKRNNVIIKISITTYDDNLAKFLEPNVISSSKRFEVLNTLRENNIYAGLLMMPILPFVTDTKENIQKCIQLAKESDAKFVYTKMGMILGKRVREYYFQNIDRLYPGLSQDYESVYEKRNVCNPLKYRELLEFFVNECNRNHILCDMSEIISDYKKKFPVKEQISLF